MYKYIYIYIYFVTTGKASGRFNQIRLSILAITVQISSYPAMTFPKALIPC